MSSTESLHMSRSESVSELNSELHSISSLRNRTNFSKDNEVTPPKFGGLGKCYIFIKIFFLQ